VLAFREYRGDFEGRNIERRSGIAEGDRCRTEHQVEKTDIWGGKAAIVCIRFVGH
jgi:hypothetical protein